MKLSTLLSATVGEFSWRAPTWLQRAGPRRVGYAAAALVTTVVLAGTAYLYYDSLPKPPQVHVEATPPDLSRIDDDELIIQPLHLDFAYPPDVYEGVAENQAAQDAAEPSPGTSPHLFSPSPAWT